MLKQSMLLLFALGLMSFSFESKAAEKFCATEDFYGSGDNAKRICPETCESSANWTGWWGEVMLNPDPDCVNEGINQQNSMCECKGPPCCRDCWTRYNGCKQGCGQAPGGKGACMAGCDATVRECVASCGGCSSASNREEASEENSAPKKPEVKKESSEANELPKDKEKDVHPEKKSGKE